MSCLSPNRNCQYFPPLTTTATTEPHSFVHIQQPNNIPTYPPAIAPRSAAAPHDPTAASFIPNPSRETASRRMMPVQLRTNTNTRVGADGGVGAGEGWTAYIRQLGRKDPAEGVTRNWVKQGRQVQQAAVVEVGRTGLGEGETVVSQHVYPPAQTPYQPTTAIPSTTSSHPSQTPAPPQATSSSTAAAARPQRAGGGNNRRPQSFYLPSDRVAHFQQAAQDVLAESGGHV